MNKRHFLSVVLAALLLTGCAAASKQAPALHDDTAFYLARFDKVWDTVITTLKEGSIPIDSMDKSRGVIRTKFVNYSVGPQAHHELEKIAEKPSATRLAILPPIDLPPMIRFLAPSCSITASQVARSTGSRSGGRCLPVCRR